MKRRSLTLIEIIVALIIMATVFLGLVATFSGVRHYTSRANVRLSLINVQRQILNNLYSGVQADTWNNFARDGAAQPVVTVDNRNYNVSYPAPNTVALDAGHNSDYVQVTVTVPTAEVR